MQLNVANHTNSINKFFMTLEKPHFGPNSGKKTSQQVFAPQKYYIFIMLCYFVDLY